MKDSISLSFAIISAVIAVSTMVVLAFFGTKQLVVAPTDDIKDDGDYVHIPGDLAPEPVTLLFAGDVMLGRYVETLMNVNGVDYPFREVHELLTSPDYTHLNLEGPITVHHVQTPNGSTNFSFLPRVASLLAAHGIDGVSLGNNHTYDQGRAVYDETRATLLASGVDVSGHPLEANEYSLLQTEVNGRPFLFVAFNLTFPSNDAEAAIDYVKTVRESHEGYLIVNVHWGEEYQLIANERQREIAHGFVDAGADLVIGHHPHVIQNIEFYNDAYIFYSLGNFIFDQYFSSDTEQGLAIELTLDEANETFRIIPIQSRRSQPFVLEGVERTQLLDGLAERSEEEIAESVRSGVLRNE